jgi:hypothetical protein
LLCATNAGGVCGHRRPPAAPSEQFRRPAALLDLVSRLAVRAAGMRPVYVPAAEVRNHTSPFLSNTATSDSSGGWAKAPPSSSRSCVWNSTTFVPDGTDRTDQLTCTKNLLGE